ncbi:MAG TPA: DNA-3-methyladenine glycosylase [Gemmatimonadaceae bacterium]|nr:DNA-3-methyladenine glycosylase [Gemmatimonadaceae bacterium]
MSTNAAHPARRSSFGPPLAPSFYDRDTERVARELLGAILLCESPEGAAAGRIVETEAYLGEHDPACHAAAGLTARTSPLYGPPGTAYVYFIYGAHWCVNAVTRAAGLPSAVLVRALEPLEGLELMRARRHHPRGDRDLTNGPGKLCAALGITDRFNGVSLAEPPLMICRGKAVSDQHVTVTPRIGITRAADWPLRWLVTESPFVSRAPRHGGRRRSRHT